MLATKLRNSAQREIQPLSGDLKKRRPSALRLAVNVKLSFYIFRTPDLAQ
jgi:hypothetical protein